MKEFGGRRRAANWAISLLVTFARQGRLVTFAHALDLRHAARGHQIGAGRACLPRNPKIESIVCLTGQHREMLDQVVRYFDLPVDADLHLMQPNQTLAGADGAMHRRNRRIADAIHAALPCGAGRYDDGDGGGDGGVLSPRAVRSCRSGTAHRQSAGALAGGIQSPRGQRGDHAALCTRRNGRPTICCAKESIRRACT